MVTASQFELNSVQTVIFTRGIEKFSPSKFLASILSKYANRYNGDITALPLSPNLPPEMPMATLASSDSAWKISAAPTRVDSIWYRNLRAAEQIDQQSIISDCVQVLEHYIQTSDIQVGRLALVITRIYPTSNPAQLLIDRFCNEESKKGPFKGSETFEIHNHKRYTLALPALNTVINSWVRCKTGQLVVENHDSDNEENISRITERVLFVEQDLNTLAKEPDSDTTYEISMIQDYFQIAGKEASNILRLYFPEEV